MARPKQFEREQALHQAMLIFWHQGYEASIPSLLKGMGISRSSLYDSFTDKQTLFAEALEHYEQLGQRRIDILRHAPSVKVGLEQFFDLLVTMALDEDYPGGCFVTNTAISYDFVDRNIQQVVSESFHDLEKELFALLERGKEAQEIAADKEISAIVSMIHCLNHGINVMAKVNKDRDTYHALVREVLGSFLD